MTRRSTKSPGLRRRLAVRGVVITSALAASLALAAPAQARTYEGWPATCSSDRKVVTVSHNTVGNYAHTHFPTSGSAKTRSGLVMSPTTVKVTFGWSKLRKFTITAADFRGINVECWKK